MCLPQGEVTEEENILHLGTHSSKRKRDRPALSMFLNSNLSAKWCHECQALPNVNRQLKVTPPSRRDPTSVHSNMVSSLDVGEDPTLETWGHGTQGSTFIYFPCPSVTKA